MTSKTKNLSPNPPDQPEQPTQAETPPPHSYPTPATEFWSGVKAIAPILLGVLPFATIIGLTAVEMGFSPLLVTGMSVIMFAGTAQLATLQLLKENTPLLVILLTAIVINLRFAMYSASIAAYFQHLPQKWKAFLAYFLTDQAFAVSITHFSDNPRNPHKLWYYLGTGLGMFFLWDLGTLAGALLGTFIPADWSLDFAIPLMFIGLVVPAVKSRAAIAAAFASGIVIVVAANIPFNLDLIVAATIGIAVGVIIQEQQKGESQH